MKVRFSVVAFVSQDARIAVCGSIPSLGSWKTPIPMSPIQIPQDQHHPSMWTTIVDIPETTFRYKSSFEYKFIRWTAGMLNVMESNVDSGNELEFPEPILVCEEDSYPTDLVWEGYGGSQNRLVVFEDTLPCSTTHVYDPSLNITPDGIYSLPVALFREPLDEVSEASHTTHYYRYLKGRGEIHFNKILDRIYVGTCPRKKEHIAELVQKHNVTDFVNLQAAEDIAENYCDVQGTPHSSRSISKVYDIFDSFNVRYTWIPTTDMCSSSRARTLAQSAFLLAGLLQRPDCTGVYIHCNAGVGRSVACIAGYMHCCLNVPIRLTNLLISARRPVAYFDEPALIQGAQDFRLKFHSAVQLFNLPRFSLGTKEKNPKGYHKDGVRKDEVKRQEGRNEGLRKDENRKILHEIERDDMMNNVVTAKIDKIYPSKAATILA